ncbi:MAG: hypothetical protein K6G08_03970 [Prevotella sp.]|nr:hypothetical protein [Prevotella sp.]
MKLNTTKRIKRLFVAVAALALIPSTAPAQNIDFNMTGRQDAEVNEPDYTGWAVNQVQSESLTLGNGLNITVAASGNANTLRAQWHKNTCTAGKNGQTGLRLMGDGVVAFIEQSDGNTPTLTDTPTSITVTISGLEAGEHSVAAYHVWKDPKNGDMPTISVDVNGQQVQTGVQFANVKQTASDLKMSDAPFSYVEFNVAEGEQVSITYTTEVAAGKTYQATNMMLNGLLIDRSPLVATDPTPFHRDFHVDADNGTLTLAWFPATVAVKHRLVMGTDAAEVEASTSYIYEGTETQFNVSGLTTAQTYYWRVDEVDATGKVFKGQVWSFRPRQLAFPGAEGYGRFAQGGRGGIVYHVTSLAGTKEPGTLLYGLTEINEPRYIVFDVSGIIELDFESYFTKPYAYIAGQTAPGKGVCIKASNINIGSDIICRHMRFKRGLGIYGENTGNAMGMSGANHAIVDHCTAAWGTDETVSGRGAYNISFQYSGIFEALGITGHKNYSDGTNHGYAATIDGQIGSWHHNLLLNCEGRNWSMGGGMDAQNIPIGGLDLFNNVCYNWHGRTTDGNCHAVNFVNNYYKMGADTRRTTLFTQDFEDAINPNGRDQAYIKGNIRENKDHSQTQDAANVTYNATGNIPTTYQYRVSEPLFPSYATIHTAKDALKIVTSTAGATMPVRDEQHKRVVSETLSGTHTYIGSKSKIKGEIDNEADIVDQENGGWEVWPEETRSADWDTDQDGMPDWWEKTIGSNPATANHNDDPDGDGWTLLEDYLDFMAHPYIALEPGTDGTIDLKQHFAGFFGQNGKSVTPTFTCEQQTDNGVSISFDGTSMLVTAADFTSPCAQNYDITVNDGSTTFTQRFGVAVTGDASQAVHPVWSEEGLDVVKRQFFTVDGKQVEKMLPHEVYLMKVTDATGRVHTVKIMKN